jgi:hypothetical protein
MDDFANLLNIHWKYISNLLKFNDILEIFNHIYKYISNFTKLYDK